MIFSGLSATQAAHRCSRVRCGATRTPTSAGGVEVVVIAVLSWLRARWTVSVLSGRSGPRSMLLSPQDRAVVDTVRPGPAVVQVYVDPVQPAVTPVEPGREPGP